MAEIEKVQKRDGRIVPFDASKIKEAVFKALTSSGEGDGKIAEKITERAVELLKRRFKKEEIPHVEQIQDIVEEVLILENLVKAAKAYILYRELRRRIREATLLSEEAVEKVKDYLDKLDWEVQENANMSFSLQGLNHYVTSHVIKKYWLNKIYPKEIREATKSGDFHIHNLDTLAAYCTGWDLYNFLLKGFGGVKTKIESRPPKHFRVALGQIVNFMYTVQGEVAGAIAFSNFDTLLAPFIRYDNLNYNQVKQAFQEFLFNMAVPTRVGFQTPFTNITLDLKPSPVFSKQPVIIGGKPQKEIYQEFEEEMKVFNKALYEIYQEGDRKGRPFHFPIPTINITKNFSWDEPAFDGIFEASAKYGINYFANYINSEMKPDDVRSMCCRLRLNLTELYNRGGGGLFGAGANTGSIGVCTINLPRIGYLSKTKREFFQRLGEVMNLAKEALEIKRKAVEDLTEKGLYPYSRYWLQDIKKARGSYWANHFSTIGLVGMNEALLNFLGENIVSKRGRKFALEVLDFMRERLVKYQKETGHIYNLEATPAESSLAPEEKVLISQSDPKLKKIGPLIDRYLERYKERVKRIGRSEVLPLKKGELFTYGFSRKDLKIKKFPVTALIRHPGDIMYQIETLSGRRVKVTKYHSVFTPGEDGLPKEIKVSELKPGDVIAIPKRIEMEERYYEFNLIEEFWKHPKIRKYLYLKTTPEFIEELITKERVKRWAENYYRFAWKDIKVCWRKRKVIPLRLIYNLNIPLKRKTLEKSTLFYRKTKGKNTSQIKTLIKLDKNLGFLLGILLAEGWLKTKKRGRIQISNTEKEIIREIEKSLSGVFGKDTFNCAQKQEERGFKKQYIITLSKIISLTIKEVFGLNQRDEKKKIPSFFYFAPKTFICGVLKGFALGGGSVYIKREKSDYYQRLYTNSKNLAQGLNILLLRLGILAKIKVDRKDKINPKWKKNYVLEISGIENLKKFYEFVLENRFEGKIKNSGREKIPRIILALENLIKKHALTRKNLEGLDILRNLKILVNGDVYWDPIKSIKKIKSSRYVYDFEVNVEGDLVENFLGGEGLVCLHNTAYRLAQKDKERYPDIITAGTKKVPYYTNCVSEDTEILTNKGWRKIDEIQKDELALTYNVEKKVLEYKRIIKIYKFPPKKRKMINIEHKYVSLLVTPNHFILYSPRGAPHKEVFTFASNLNNYFNIRVAASLRPPKNKKFSDDFIKLLAWIISEGHFEKGNAGIRIYQSSNPGCILEIRNTLKNLNLQFKELEYKVKTFGRERKEILFRIPAEAGKEIRKVIDKKEIPREILNKVTSRQAGILIDTIVKGGGTRYKTYSVINTANSKLADQLMELAIKAGRYVSVHDYRDLTGVFHIVVSNKQRRLQKHQISKKLHVREVNYEGRVWCIETENRTILVRRKIKNTYKYCITGNSTQLPVNFTDDIFEALKLQDELQCKYSGGTVFHIFLGERMPSVESVKILVKKVFENFHLPYITITPTFSVCPVHGYLLGEHFFCPKCTIKQPCEVYSRIVGYIRPISQWNEGKQQEFKERKEFKVRLKELIKEKEG